MDYKFAYLVLSLILGIFWFVIFYLRKDLRKAVLTTSIFVSGFGLSEMFFFGEYWKPQFIFQIPGINIGIEDLILCFFYGGIAAGLYKFVFQKTLSQLQKPRNITKMRFIIIATVLFGLLINVFFSQVFHWNLIYASSLSLIFAGCINLIFRKDLLKPILINSILIFFVMLIWYRIVLLLYPEIFNQFWLIDRISGTFLLGIPIEEFLWHISMAFAFGGTYELANNFTIK